LLGLRRRCRRRLGGALGRWSAAFIAIATPTAFAAALVVAALLR
jgi:hypothetical protein